jgi:radical SAM superfamily enzyme
MKVDGVKIHLLHILRGSELEALYHEGKITLMSREEYVETACDFLEELSADIVIQRITGEGSREDHIAPAWALDKIGTINMIKDTLAKRKSFQGKAICGSRL